jgi:hypothetical protein
MLNSSSVSTPFTQLIQDFKGKKLPSQQIELEVIQLSGRASLFA